MKCAATCSRGFPAVKLKIGFGVGGRCGPDPGLPCEAIGPKIGLMLDANHGYDAVEAVALGRRHRRLRNRLVRGACGAGGPRQLPRGAARPADTGGGRRDLVCALEFPARRSAPAPSTSSSPISARSAGFRSQEDRRHGRHIRRALRAARVGHRHRTCGRALQLHGRAACTTRRGKLQSSPCLEFDRSGTSLPPGDPEGADRAHFGNGDDPARPGFRNRGGSRHACALASKAA